METDVGPIKDEDEGDADAGDETRNVPPLYKNPYSMRHSLQFSFVGTSFVGVGSHIAFQGISNEAPVLSNLLAAIRVNANTGSDLDFMPFGYNARFSAKFLFDYFSDSFVDFDKVLRLKGSPLRWNASVIRRFSNFVKTVLVESSPSSRGVGAMKRPLRVLIDNCAFIGGASFMFSNILPVGSKIIMRNSTVTAMYDQYSHDNIFFTNVAQTSAHGVLNFFQVYMFGSEIRLKENDIRFFRPPGTSANSSILRNSVNLPAHTHAITSVISFAGNSFLLHSTSVSVLRTKVNAEAVGTDRAVFKHPNISMWQNLIKAYRIYPAVANSFLTANLPVMFASIISASEALQVALITEGSFLTVVDVNGGIDARSVLVPASDDMWVNTTTPSSSNGPPTTTMTKVPPPTATMSTTITLDEFYKLYPDVAPSNCYVLEVPTQISFSIFHFRAKRMELTQAASLDFIDINIRSIGAQPRGGKLAREPFIEDPDSDRILNPTLIQTVGAGNSFLLSTKLITDATALKIVIEIAETLFTAHNNETYAKVGENFRRTNGYYTSDPESLAIPSDSLTLFAQVRSGVANKSLIDKFMRIEREIMGDDEPIHTSPPRFEDGGEELHPRDFSDIVKNSYNYHFTSPTRVSSTPSSRALYEKLFEGSLQKPLPFTIVFEHTYDIQGITTLHRTCGLNGTLKISADLIDLAREVKHVFSSLKYDPVRAAIELEREEGEMSPIRIEEIGGAGGSEPPLFIASAYATISNPLSDPAHVREQQQVVDAYENATQRLRDVISRYYIQASSGIESDEIPPLTLIYGAANTVSVDIMSAWYQTPLVVNGSTVQIAGCFIYMQGIFVNAKLMGPVQLELLDNSGVFIHEFNEINLNNTVAMSGLRSSNPYPSLNFDFTVAALEIRGANLAGPDAYICISNFKLVAKYHKAFIGSNVFAALLLTIAIGGKPILNVVGDNTLLDIEHVHFDTDTATESRLQWTTFNTHVTAVYCNSHLAIDGANTDPKSTVPSPFLPSPPVISVSNVYYDTRADICIRSAFAFASGLDKSLITNGGSLYINRIYFLTSQLARTPFYREAFQTNVLSILTVNRLTLSNRGNIFISDVVASPDSPSLVSCGKHNLLCPASHSIAWVTGTLDVSAASLFIVRNVLLSVEIKNRGYTRIALLDASHVLTVSGGSRLIFENISLTTQMPTMILFNVSQKVYLAIPDTMRTRGVAISGILLQGGANLQLRDRSTQVQLSHVAIKAETVGNKTEEFTASVIKIYRNARIATSNGAGVQIDSCNITILPWDAPLEQKVLMEKSATAKLNPWSWKSFSQELSDNTNNRKVNGSRSLRQSYGGRTAPKRTRCSVLDSEGELQVVPSWTPLSSLPLSAFSSIRISNVVANLFCGMQTNRTQEESTPSIHSSVGGLEYPLLAVSAFLFSPLQNQTFGSYEGLTVTNLALSVFCSFADETNGSLTSVWRPAVYPLFLGKIRVVDGQAKFTTQDAMDVNNAVTRGTQYSEPQIDFAKRGALRALLRACDITVNGVPINSNMDSYFYPFGYNGENITEIISERKFGQQSGDRDANSFAFSNSSSNDGLYTNLDWVARGLEVELSATNFTSLNIANGGITLGMVDPSRGYAYNIRTFLQNYVDFCPRTKTSEITMTTSIELSKSVSRASSKTRRAEIPRTQTISLAKLASSTILSLLVTTSLSSSISKGISELCTKRVTATPSVTASKSAVGECDLKSVRDGGAYWREHITSQQLNSQSHWWKRLYERDVVHGMRLTFESHVPIPPNTSNWSRSGSAMDGETVSTRAILIESAVAPKRRPINFHGVRRASSPSHPYLDVTVFENGSVVLEMRPLPKLETYNEEWWDVYLPVGALVGEACALELAQNRSYGEMWEAITLSEAQSKLVSKEGTIENPFAYFATVIIEPNVPKPLANFANGFAAAANSFAILSGALSSTVIASPSAEIQAVGILAHMSACNSPQINEVFGSPWLLSPVYIGSAFGHGEQNEMLGVIIGNFLLIGFFAVVQMTTLLLVKLRCHPAPGSEMTIFGAARFPSVLLSVMLGVHGGSVFAASRIVRLASLNRENAAYLIPAALVIVYYVALPACLYLSAWWCIPRTFQVYDIEHESMQQLVKQPRLITKLLPIGAIYPTSTRQSVGAFVSSFRRSSHIWVTSPLWVSTVSGLVGFADFDGVEGNTKACSTWGILIGFVFLLMAALMLWRMPKRHMMLTIIDVVALAGLALLYGFTVPWRQIVYPPNELFSQGEAGQINWPDLIVVILSFIIICLVALRAILSLFICAVEIRIQSMDLPTRLLWSHKSGGQMRAERQAAISRLEADRAILDELFVQTSVQDNTVLPTAPFFAEQNESSISKKNGSESEQTYSPPRQKSRRGELSVKKHMRPIEPPSVEHIEDLDLDLQELDEIV